ncbi:unnamed protein product [Arctia plantaginis]|uniref:Uncharacterized protein n=1 Tax=Arctia plantaginis TaxID=874455 RepID=A0A8S0YU15_ARCPL|nr:unnamed protein product [Arctia plantaginis]
MAMRAPRGEEPRAMSGRGRGWRARRRGTPIAASYGHVPGVVVRRYLRNRHTLPRYGKGSLYLHRNTRTVAGGGAGRVRSGSGVALGACWRLTGAGRRATARPARPSICASRCAN